VTSVFHEGTQTFTFPSSWQVIHYDLTNHHQHAGKWSFRVRLTRKPETWSPHPIGQKAVDFAAIDHANQLILIEVKDYRVGATVLPSHLPDVFAQKVQGTLFGLALAAQNPASDAHHLGQALTVAKAIHAYLDVRWPTVGGSLLAPSPQTMRANVLAKAKVTMPTLVTVHVVDRSTAVAWSVT
jgi:hypothetical protein